MAKNKRKSKPAADANTETQKADAEFSESPESPMNSDNGQQAEDPNMNVGMTEAAADANHEDLLDGLRRTLVDDDDEQNENRTRNWWSRVGRGSQDDVTAVSGRHGAAGGWDMRIHPDPDPEDEMKNTGQAAESFGDQGEQDLVLPQEIDSAEFSYESEPAVDDFGEPTHTNYDVDELKKKAFQPRVYSPDEQEIAEIRSMVKEGDDIFVEVPTQSSDRIESGVARVENALRPYRRIIYVAIVLFVLAVIAVSGILGFAIYQSYWPEKSQTEAVVLPYPVGLILPGDLVFELGKGRLTKGEWNPAGPEWLEGTEICRWFAIPSSPQMEAVVKTFEPGDSITLVMSNNDKLKYNVDSVRERSTAQLQRLDTNSPCLLLILAKAETDSRWVVTALP